MPAEILLPFLFILGTVFGSFLNVCVHRFPPHDLLRDQLKALWHSGSACPRCQTAIRVYDNIPVLGWLILRGKCRNCKGSISFRYPLVEFITGLLFVAVYWLEVPVDYYITAKGSVLFDSQGPQTIEGGLSDFWWLHLRYVLHMAMICGLLVASLIDLEVRLIPDGTTVPVMILALIAMVGIGQVHIVPVWFQDVSIVRTLRPGAPEWIQPLLFEWNAVPWAQRHPHFHGLAVSVAGLLVGGGIVWAVRLIGFWILRQEAMGFGDVVLMAMIGSVIGWQPVVAVFFMAPILAVFAAAATWLVRRDRMIPYGPWLSLATVILLLTWPHSWPVVRRIFDFGPLLPLIGLLLVISFTTCLLLIQLVKRILGIELYPDSGAEWTSQWTSSDHLMYYNHADSGDRKGLRGRNLRHQQLGVSLRRRMNRRWRRRS